MRAFTAALWGETLKVWRSRIFWATLGIFVFIPLMLGLIMFLALHPEIAHQFGIVGAKADLLRFEQVDWAAFGDFLNIALAGVGIIGFGFVLSWIFGREFADHTVVDWLALPTARTTIVWAKYCIGMLWCLWLAVIMYGSGVGIGLLIQLTGWQPERFLHFSNSYWGTALLTIMVSTPVAFFASWGRGYLLPIGFVVGMLMLAQFVGVLGWSAYFPWAIPLQFAWSSGGATAPLTTVSYLIVVFTGLLGIFFTLAWWKWADH